MQPDTLHAKAYPVSLNLRGKRCLVVGAGNVAARKIEGLLAAGALISVVAPTANSAVEQWFANGALDLIRRSFERHDAAGMALLYACTNDESVNRLAAEAGRDAGALVNRSDDADDCDFTGMSTVERGNLVIGISTGAESPAFSRWIRKRIEGQIGPEYGRLLAMIAALRPEVKTVLPDQNRSSAWERALESEALVLLQRGDSEGALKALRRSLGLSDHPDET